MMNRSYLPFLSAREYQDRGVAKWMGFFLSEHTSALSDDDKQINYLSDLSLNQKLLLLSQSYANQLTIQVTRIQKNEYQRKFEKNWPYGVLAVGVGSDCWGYIDMVLLAIAQLLY